MAKNIIARTQRTLSHIWEHPNSRSNRIKAILNFFIWQIYKRLTKNKIIIPLINDIKLYCYPDSQSASHALYCSLYDYHEMNFLLRYLKNNDSFIDIGANIGIYTLIAASKIKEGYIYSFEALPKNYQRLLENINLNQLNTVKPYELAISNTKGKIALDLSDEDCTPSITTDKYDSTFIVNTDQLDNLATNQIPFNQISIGKMDIEGAELLAFKGAASLLSSKKPPVWIIEILNKQDTELIDLLQSYDYGLYIYDADFRDCS